MRNGSAHQRRLRRWRAAPVVVGFGLPAVAGWGFETHQPRLPEAGPAPVPAQALAPSQASRVPVVPDRPLLLELPAVRPGAAVIVQTAGGPEHWTVDGVRTYLKGHVPAVLFTGTSPRLVIITCGGPFDWATHHYDDNVVVYASPARAGAR